MSQLPDRITIIFDGSCNFCTWSVELIDRLDWHGRVHPVPFQGQGVLTEYALTQAAAEAAVWAITPAGDRYRGAAAINLALAVALNSRLPLILYQLPGVHQLQDAIYAAIARNRHRFRGVVPYCRQHPEACA